MELAQKNKFRKIAKNISWLSFDRMLRMSVSLFVGSWTARYLGPEQYGMYNYAIALISLLAPLSTLGLDSTVIRDIVNHPEHKDHIVNTAFIAKSVAGLVTLLCVAIWIVLYKPYSETLSALVIISGISILIRPFDTIDYYFQAITSSKYSVYARSTAFFCSSFLKVSFIKMQASIEGIVSTDMIESIIGGAGLYAIYRGKGNKINPLKFSRETFSTLLLDSWPLIISSSLIMVYMRIDQIMIASLLGNQETGVYAAAVRIAEISYFVPMVVVSSTFPVIVEKKNQSAKELDRGMQRLYKILTALSYVTSILLTLCSEPIVLNLYGYSYSPAVSSLVVLAWSSTWVGLGIARSSYLSAINRNILHLKSIAFATLLNVALNYVLIPRIGIIGAGVATNISYSFAAYFSCFLYRELRQTGCMMTKAVIFPGV